LVALVQMIIAAQLEAAEGQQQQQQQGDAAGSLVRATAGEQQPGRQPPQTVLGALYGAVVDNSAYERFYKRFMHVAQRNLNRMASTLGDLAATASAGRGSSDKEAES
jgi:folate-dependent tRNA-U54 methylase TrmFO/GidA